MWRRFSWYFLLFLTACSAPSVPEGASLPPAASVITPTVGIEESITQEPDNSSVAINRRVPVEEEFSFGFSLGFDSIQPIYSPEFVPASDAPLEDQELVLGVAWDGEAKAYPISVLRYREMVDDELAGIPTLVTW